MQPPEVLLQKALSMWRPADVSNLALHFSILLLSCCCGLLVNYCPEHVIMVSEKYKCLSVHGCDVTYKES